MFHTNDRLSSLKTSKYRMYCLEMHCVVSAHCITNSGAVSSQVSVDWLGVGRSSLGSAGLGSESRRGPALFHTCLILVGLVGALEHFLFMAEAEIQEGDLALCDASSGRGSGLTSIIACNIPLANLPSLGREIYFTSNGRNRKVVSQRVSKERRTIMQPTTQM